MNNDDSDPKIIARMEAYLEGIEARNNAPYDGVLGLLPDWVPDWHQQEFIKTRNSLLNGGIYGEPVTREQIIEWMDAYCRLGNTPEGEVSRDYIPIERMKPIGDLAHYRYAVSLGPIDGLKLLAGKDAVSGMKSRNGIKNRADYLDKQDFQRIAAPLFEQNGYNITQTLEEQQLEAYVRKWPRAVRGWLTEIRPAGAMQKGRPKKR